MTNEYKKTLNLPKTDFPIRANLAKVEEECLAFWKDSDIYAKLQEKNKDNPKYILHDGPPYPNGDIHLGHALNKILKDIVVKQRSMNGFLTPYLPGWDCHGLPIEIQLIKKIGPEYRNMAIGDFREKCAEYALGYVDTQRTEFMRLGILGQWFKPYLTLDHDYEAAIIRTFGKMAEEGYIYRGLKPIHWCPSCETALAEAEIEYEEDKSYSIYVKFKVVNIDSAKESIKFFSKADIKNTYFVIWTTTPWTLPANVAIAVHPSLEYVLVKSNDSFFVLAEGLLESFKNITTVEDISVISKIKGSDLEKIICRHPFISREVPVVTDRLVTLEQGTGCVHIAPGHGAEDYGVGLKYHLPIIMPVDDRGKFTAEIPELEGLFYKKANEVILDWLKKEKALLHVGSLVHQYPHCWRCKKPVIFRATEQWFVSIDHKDLRKHTLAKIKEVTWFPSWGQNRINGMVESRPDWCISRQRSWGVPIPAFYCTHCGEVGITGAFNKAVVDLVLQQGTDAWFKFDPLEILPEEVKCKKCGSRDFKKETDILDVWFESGTSHIAVLDGNPSMSWPADLYLEGSDQHRGWFQTSLLIGMAAKNNSPYKAVLTHGFTVDEKGKKMSKSLGNVIDPQKVVKQYVADVLRLWVASTDFRGDMSASESILKHVQEAYIKIRNTVRFLISNLYDFDPANNSVSYDDLEQLDKYALLVFEKLKRRVLKAYDDFELHVVYHSIYDYCVNDLSAFYLDIAKDILYCDNNNSKNRRSLQTVLYYVLTELPKLFAPILSFTAENIWKYINSNIPAAGLEESILLSDMPQTEDEWLNDKLEQDMAFIWEVREEVYRILEGARTNKQIASSLEADVELYVDNKHKEKLVEVEDLLTKVFICSRVKVFDDKISPQEAVSGQKLNYLKIIVKRSAFKKCIRCWNYRESVGSHKAHPELCTRCFKVVEQ